MEGGVGVMAKRRGKDIKGLETNLYCSFSCIWYI